MGPAPAPGWAAGRAHGQCSLGLDAQRQDRSRRAGRCHDHQRKTPPDVDAEAEQAYRLAAQFWPEKPESIGGLANLLVRSGRENEARQTFEEFIRHQRKELDRVSAAWRVIAPAPLSKP